MPSPTRRHSRLLVTVLSMSFAVGATASCADDEPASGETTSETFTINVGHVGPAGDPITLVLEDVADRVEERTDGNVVLEIFPDGQLGQGQDMLAQVKSGAAQFGHMDPGYAADIGGVPEMSVLNGPFLFDDAAEIAAVLDTDLGQDILGRLESEGWHSLAWNWYLGERHLIGNEGYPSPEDLEGVKIRVPPSAVWVETFSALPTVPTTMEFAEIYTGLSQGVIDAAEGPLAGLKGASLHEVADTITLTSHFKAATGWVTSMDFWNSLPEEYQTVLTEEFEAGGEELTTISVKQEQELRDEFENDLGVTLVEADVAAYTEAVAGFYDAFPEWRDGLHDQIVEILREHRGQ